MASEIPNSSDRSKTYWTPAMECYFMDLMLDHMHGGSRVGHTFNKPAWADMLTAFNAKFGFQYDKDILKNHYALLWKQFNDIKILLDQSGFSWDDTQQMVVANDYVWDTYVKAYPDAQYYRNKAVTSFNDLCLIYAYTTADGRYSRSSHDIDFDDELQGLNIVGGKEEQTLICSNYSWTDWTSLMDHCLIDLLLDQLRRGNKIGCAFFIQDWNEMISRFNARFGSHFDKEVLKNRYKQLRQQYNDVKILLGQRGFSWDETQELVIAEDYVWDSYTKAYPDARLYKFKTVPSFHKLCVIYGEEGSIGRPSRMVDNVGFNGEDPVLMTDYNYARTNWTPSMDRHLIDLMLKQVHKGHRIGDVLNKQAWIRVVAAFSDRFGSQYDKYMLSGRHKSLRKLYHDMKNLLDWYEFSWDETRQMVTAHGDVWDAYIKEHPDAKSFRMRTKPNYHDLSMIYGISTSDGRDNQTDHGGRFNGDGRDIQAVENGIRLRICWTPPMDRYFIDLMLEQIRRGSMTYQHFNKQAWSDMVLKFNSNFGSQHHKDVLKRRFDSLRKQFIDIKTLLDQSGFAWDEMQQMITANDNLWDGCIKENPEAQSYRNQMLLNYNDLFLIYGNAFSKGDHDHSSHYINVKDDVLGVNIGQQDDESSAGTNFRMIDWTKQMDLYFIDLMLEQVLEGNKIDRTFNRQAWIYMITLFNEKFGLDFDKDTMENRYLSLMKQYEDTSHLLKQNGFAWDEYQQMIIADDDVWEDYIKAHPDAVVYKDKILGSCRDLSIIFGNEILDGGSSYLDPEMDIDDDSLEMEMNRIFEDIESSLRDIELPHPRKKRRSATSSTSAYSRRVKKTSNYKLQETGRSGMQCTDPSSIESVVDALQAVPDMDDELFLGACTLLEDEKKAKAFVKMDIMQRKKWLLRNLRS